MKRFLLVVFILYIRQHPIGYVNGGEYPTWQACEDARAAYLAGHWLNAGHYVATCGTKYSFPRN
jgi:hypothetical protein